MVMHVGKRYSARAPPINDLPRPVGVLSIGLTGPQTAVSKIFPPTLASLYFIVFHPFSGVIMHVGWMGVVV